MQTSKPSGGKQPLGATLRSWWWFVPAYGLIYHFADPLLDWVLAHPYTGVALIGLASSTVFALDALRLWRDGSDVARDLRERMLNGGDGRTTDLRAVYVIVAALVAVWLAVLAVAVTEASPAQRPAVALIVGGITALVAAPFALYPLALLFGILSPPGSFEARVVLQLERPVTDILSRRTELAGMPSYHGLGAPVAAGDGHWRSAAISPWARLTGMDTTYRVEPSEPDRLTIHASTKGGDRERIALAVTSETRIDATLRIDACSAWSRAVLRIAGARSMASTIGAAEAARLTRMLGVTVTADTPELTTH